METYDLVVVGELLVDLLPSHRGDLSKTERLEVHSGGAPANVAVGVSRLGGRSAIISVVGDDQFGRLATRRLEADGVDCTAVRIMPGEQTGLCFITLDAHGERTFTHRGGDPFSDLRATDIAVRLVAQARCIEFSCGAIRSETSHLAVMRAIEATQGLVAFDPGCCPPAWGDPAVVGQRTLELICHCDVFKCSREEAEALVVTDDPEVAAKRLLSRGAGLAIVTDGPNGAYYARDSDSARVLAPQVDVVDTTGAGDAFMAGLLSQLLEHDLDPSSCHRSDLIDAISYACRVGAAAVTARGAVTGIPHPDGGLPLPAPPPVLAQ